MHLIDTLLECKLQYDRNRLRENKEDELLQETSLWMKLRVIYKLFAYLILFTYPFEKG